MYLEDFLYKVRGYLFEQWKVIVNIFCILFVMMLIFSFSIVYLGAPDFFREIGINHNITLHEVSLHELTWFILVVFIIISLIYYRKIICGLLNRTKEIGLGGGSIKFEPLFGEDIHKKTTGTIRDTFLIYGNYLFKSESDYSEAIHQYRIAHQIKKSVLSGYMILSCCLKIDLDMESIVSTYDDALEVAKISTYNGEKLDEIRFKLRRLIIDMKEKRDQLGSKEFTVELKKELDIFEEKTWPWIRNNISVQNKHKRNA